MTDGEKLIELARKMNAEWEKIENWRRKNVMATNGQAPNWEEYRVARNRLKAKIATIR